MEWKESEDGSDREGSTETETDTVRLEQDMVVMGIFGSGCGGEEGRGPRKKVWSASGSCLFVVGLGKKLGHLFPLPPVLSAFNSFNREKWHFQVRWLIFLKRFNQLD